METCQWLRQWSAAYLWRLCCKDASRTLQGLPNDQMHQFNDSRLGIAEEFQVNNGKCLTTTHLNVFKKKSSKPWAKQELMLMVKLQLTQRKMSHGYRQPSPVLAKGLGGQRTRGSFCGSTTLRPGWCLARSWFSPLSRWPSSYIRFQEPLWLWCCFQTGHLTFVLLQSILPKLSAFWSYWKG